MLVKVFRIVKMSQKTRYYAKTPLRALYGALNCIVGIIPTYIFHSLSVKYLTQPTINKYLTQPTINKYLTQPTSQSKDCRSGGQAVRRITISIKAKQRSIIISRSIKKSTRAIIQRHSF